jgi:hypothetical protein
MIPALLSPDVKNDTSIIGVMRYLIRHADLLQEL